MKRKIKVIRRRNGHDITYLTEDKGKSGRTPGEDRWYHSNMDTGWEKDMPEDTRRALMLKAHGGDVLAAARALIALCNVTTDMKTKHEARKDADYFLKAYRKKRESLDYRRISKNVIPISPRPRPLT